MAQEEYMGLTGLRYLWEKISNTFVKKNGRKVLSDNNFSDEDKEKLDGLTNYTLPVASSTTLGGVRLGNNLTTDVRGRLIYNLPIATGSQLGGVRVGSGLEVNSSGVLSVAVTADDVTRLAVEIEDLKTEIGKDDALNKLLPDMLPGTEQSITFALNGDVESIVHKSGETTVRTDSYVFGQDNIREVRRLSTGETLTIVTNTETLVTNITYEEAA